MGVSSQTVQRSKTWEQGKGETAGKVYIKPKPTKSAIHVKYSTHGDFPCYILTSGGYS